MCIGVVSIVWGYDNFSSAKFFHIDLFGWVKSVYNKFSLSPDKYAREYPVCSFGNE